MFVLSFPSAAAWRTEERFVEKGDEIIYIVVGLQNDVPSPATISAVGPAVWNKFFPAKATAPIAAVARFGVNANLINKFHDGTRWPTCWRESNGFLARCCKTISGSEQGRICESCNAAFQPVQAGVHRVERAFL